jgi:amino-acid N-acetyltransferase
MFPAGRLPEFLRLNCLQPEQQYSWVRMANAQYTAAVLEAYEDEVAGAAYFDALASVYPRKAAFFRKCAALERATAIELGALIGKYQLTPQSRAALEERGARDTRADGVMHWRELMQQSIRSYARYVDEFRALEAIGPAEDQPVLAALTAHEVRLIEWLREEVGSSGFPVRAATAADAAAIRDLILGAGLPVADLDRAPGLRFWVVEDGDRIVGAIGLEAFGAAGLLRSLAVAPPHRQHGLGSALVAALEREARTKGLELLVLLTETAEAFFAQRGYAAVERAHVPGEIRQSAQFRSLCPASAVCMVKRLLAPRVAMSDAG